MLSKVSSLLYFYACYYDCTGFPSALFHICHGINVALAEHGGSDGTSDVCLTLEMSASV